MSVSAIPAFVGQFDGVLVESSDQTLHQTILNQSPVNMKHAAIVFLELHNYILTYSGIVGVHQNHKMHRSTDIISQV